MTRIKPPFLGRYTHLGALKSHRDARSFVALEADTGRRVVAAVVSPSQLANLEVARGIGNSHLAQVFESSRSFEPETAPDLSDVPNGHGVAVAELVPGRTLHQYLSGKPMSPVKAVAWVLRLIDAVMALHVRGAYHGAISPFSVIAEPEGRAIAPVLSQLVVPPVGPYCPPERLKGMSPSPADDVWALFATLYTALTGQAPFTGKTRDDLIRQMQSGKPKSLLAQGVDEPVLQEILDRGLSGDRRMRVAELAELTKLLDAWERDPRAMPAKRSAMPRPMPKGLMDIAGGAMPAGLREDEIVVDPSVLSENAGSAALASAPMVDALPPPDPALVASADTKSLVALARELPVPPPVPPVRTMGAVAKRLSFNPFERKRRVWPLVACAAAVSAAGMYLAVGTRSVPPPAVPAPAEAAPAPVVAKPAKPKVDPAEARDACVRSHFEEGALNDTEGYAFVCGDGDFRELSRQLFAKASKQGDAVDPARTANQSELGWYELPATAIIRKSCCTATPPVILPETTGWCEQLQSVVRRIAEDSAKAGDLAPGARSFDKAVGCLYANRINRPYLYERAPSQKNRAAFQQFLSRAAITQARR